MCYNKPLWAPQLDQQLRYPQYLPMQHKEDVLSLLNSPSGRPSLLVLFSHGNRNITISSLSLQMSQPSLGSQESLIPLFSSNYSPHYQSPCMGLTTRLGLITHSTTYSSLSASQCNRLTQGCNRQITTLVQGSSQHGYTKTTQNYSTYSLCIATHKILQLLL